MKRKSRSPGLGDARVSLWLHSARTNAPVPSVLHQGTRWFVGQPGEEFTVRVEVSGLDFERLDLDAHATLDGRSSGFSKAWYSRASAAHVGWPEPSDPPAEGGPWELGTRPYQGEPWRLEFDGWAAGLDAGGHAQFVQSFKFCSLRDDDAQPAKPVATGRGADNGTIRFEVSECRMLWGSCAAPTPSAAFGVPASGASNGDDKKWFAKPGLATGAGQVSAESKLLDDNTFQLLDMLAEASIKYDIESSLRLRGIIPSDIAVPAACNAPALAHGERTTIKREARKDTGSNTGSVIDLTAQADLSDNLGATPDTPIEL